MSHPLLSTPRSDRSGAARVSRPEVWAARPDAGPTVAVLLTACRDVAAAVRGYRTMMPGAGIYLYGDDLSSADVSAARAAGATVRPVPVSRRDVLVCRMLAEVEADIYILAHGAGLGDICVAPLLVAEIDRGGQELVDVARCGETPSRDAGDRLLSAVVDFLFGRGGDVLISDFKACSRRFALSYRAARAGRTRDLPSALDLALHALQHRMPVGRVAALSAPEGGEARPSPRDLGSWARLLALALRLMVEERPRRSFGLLGLASMALGLAATAPWLSVLQGRATLALGPGSLAAVALVAGGGALGVAGLLLDTLAAARQEVRRIGTLAIPRRADRQAPPAGR